MRHQTSARRQAIEAEYQARREAAIKAARNWRLNKCGICGDPGHAEEACDK